MDELFEIFDENNQKIGTEKRSVVHKTGLFHRSVNVLLFNSRGELLIQQRMPTKDVCPSRWDLSVAEHLKPGESYKEAALRGLKEELNITVSDAELIRSAKLQKGEYPQLGVKDYEFTECYKVIYDGDVKVDGEEVACAKFIDMDELSKWIDAKPADFTPWFLDEWRHLTRK